MYRLVVTTQYMKRWEQYREANVADKKVLFRELLPVKKLIHNYFGTKLIKKIFLINALVVDVIIGEILEDPGDIKVQTLANMTVCLHDAADNYVALVGSKGIDFYCDVIKNHLQLSLGIDCLSVEPSFCQVARGLLTIEKCSKLARIGACNS